MIRVILKLRQFSEILDICMEIRFFFHLLQEHIKDTEASPNARSLYIGEASDRWP